MKNNNYSINWADAAQTMPRRIEDNAKTMRIGNTGAYVQLALDVSNDSKGMCLTIKVLHGKNYGFIQYDERHERAFYPNHRYIARELADKVLTTCLEKLSVRFPIKEEIKKDSSAATEESKNGSEPSKHWIRPKMA